MMQAIQAMRSRQMKQALAACDRSIGISLVICSATDTRIQSHPIAMWQSSSDTSNHFQRDSQQPEKSQ